MLPLGQAVIVPLRFTHNTLYHSYLSVFAVLTTVVNIKLILEPTCIFYELSVFYRPARSYLLSFILWLYNDRFPRIFTP